MLRHLKGSKEYIYLNNGVTLDAVWGSIPNADQHASYTGRPPKTDFDRLVVFKNGICRAVKTRNNYFTKGTLCRLRKKIPLDNEIKGGSRRLIKKLQVVSWHFTCSRAFETPQWIFLCLIFFLAIPDNLIIDDADASFCR